MIFELGGALNLPLRAIGKRRCVVQASIVLAPTRTQLMSYDVSSGIYLFQACFRPDGKFPPVSSAT